MTLHLPVLHGDVLQVGVELDGLVRRRSGFVLEASAKGTAHESATRSLQATEHSVRTMLVFSPSQKCRS